jgi:hypothetical protein
MDLGEEKLVGPINIRKLAVVSLSLFWTKGAIDRGVGARKHTEQEARKYQRSIHLIPTKHRR